MVKHFCEASNCLLVLTLSCHFIRIPCVIINLFLEATHTLHKGVPFKLWPTISNLKVNFLSRKKEILIRKSLINWSGTSKRKFYKRIPRNSDPGSFYKEFQLIFFFTGKSSVNFFRTFKLEIEFHSHKKVVSPKLENSAHLFIVNFKRAKFQKN